MRKIKVYGPLAKFLGWKEMEANCKSAAEAVKFIVTNWPEVEGHMSNQYYKVQVKEEIIDKDELHNNSGGDIHIVPVVSGAKFWKILLGAALIGLSFGAFGAFGAKVVAWKAGTGLSFATAGWGAKTAFAVGSSLVLSGVADMLAPPLPESDNDPGRAFSFSGLQNTIAAGTPIPVVYGEVWTGSVVIGQNLDSTGPHELIYAPSGGV